MCALLHDSIEDQSEKLAALAPKGSTGDSRSIALQYIQSRFGERVGNIIASVTKPESPPGMPEQEKNEKYFRFVSAAIENIDAFYVKLSDFLDNALRIESIPDPVFQKELATKYRPLFDIFINRLQRADVKIPRERRAEILTYLVAAKTFVNQLLVRKASGEYTSS